MTGRVAERFANGARSRQRQQKAMHAREGDRIGGAIITLRNARLPQPEPAILVGVFAAEALNRGSSRGRRCARGRRATSRRGRRRNWFGA